ncbi:MAG: Zn-ribbon domain-containing OB-fold protein [Planctomycetes bacterium]|nr:Zn-ribbon domain-containing OB-fold protein [Planctomycetota bacterium]
MNRYDFRGTTVSERDVSLGKILSVPGETGAKYAWDTGAAIGRYLEGLKAGKILGIRCRDCDRTVVPPRAFCEKCFGEAVETVQLPDTGTVNTFSLCYVTWDVQRLQHPMIPAVVDIDGTNPRAGILHLLDRVHPDEVRIGMRVQAVWKAPDQREGAITDIMYFRPLPT